MTITEAQACKARGMSRDQVERQLIASLAAQQRADVLTLQRVYGLTPVRHMEAYDYNGDRR